MGKTNALFWRSDHGSVTEENDNMTLLRPELFTIQAIEGLTAKGEEQDILWDVRQAFRDGEKEDSVTKAVAKLCQGHSCSVHAAEWSKQDRLLLFRGKVYVPNDPELCRRIISQHHDTRVAGHAGRWKTLELMSHNYWRLQMS